MDMLLTSVNVTDDINYHKLYSTYFRQLRMKFNTCIQAVLICNTYESKIRLTCTSQSGESSKHIRGIHLD